MATVTLTRDDITPEIVEDVETVALAYQGKQVVIDLGPENRQKLGEFLLPFLAAGRTAGGEAAQAKPATRTPRTRKAAVATPATKPTAVTALPVNGEKKLSRAEAAKENETIRAWAAQNGIELSAQGRIPNDVKLRWRTSLTSLGEQSLSA